MKKNLLRRIYIDKGLALSIIIIDYKTPKSIWFTTNLGFNQHDLVMTKKQSVLTKIMKVFSSEEILSSTLF